MPSASVSVPSFAMFGLPAMAQSSQVSPSRSWQARGSSGSESDPSGTVSLSSSGSPASQRPSPSVSAPSFAGLEIPATEQSSQVSPSESPQMNGSSGAGSVPSGIPSLSSSVSPASQMPSASVSVPSFAMFGLPATEQSSQVSPSASWQPNGSSGAMSLPSGTVSLSSSGSPASQRPSPSVSVPSSRGLKVPVAQSSQVSPSVSAHTKRFSGLESAPSTTPSLSSSESPASHRPSPSKSGPSLPASTVPLAQSSQVSPSASWHWNGSVGFESPPSFTPSLSSSGSTSSQRPSPSVSSSPMPQPQKPGSVFSGSPGHWSMQSGVPSRSVSVGQSVTGEYVVKVTCSHWPTAGEPGAMVIVDSTRDAPFQNKR